MIEQEQRQLIKRYLDMALRRHKIIIFFLLVGIAGGLLYYSQAPKRYKATSLMKYQRQRVNPTRMSPDDVRSQTQEVVSTVSQQVTSRTSLENIIVQHNLYPQMRANAPMEDVVAMMRSHHISIKRAGSRGDVYEISYQGGNPRTVMLVTNALAAKFIEENLRFRAEQASDTSSYIQDELAMAKRSLDEKEAVMRDYKLKNYNEMPDQQQANVSRLNALQTQYQSVQSSIHEMERTKVMVQEQISLRKDLLAQLARAGQPQSPASPLVAGPSEEERRLAALRSELASLESRYTANHPGVRRLQRQIAELEEQIPEAQDVETVDDASEDEASGPRPVSPSAMDPQLQQLAQQLKQLTFDISQLKGDGPKIQQEIGKYQRWVEATPIREAEWAALTRDYDQLNAHYQDLVARSLEAQSAYTLEKQQKGSQFKIVDPAHMPEKPFSPDFIKMVGMAVAGGLGVGCAIGLGLELLSTSFKDPFDLEKNLGVPVLCAIPYVPMQKEIIRKRVVNIVWWVFCVCCCLGLAGAIVYLKKSGILIV